MESMDEEKIEDYLKRQGISSMQDTGPKKLVCATTGLSAKCVLHPLRAIAPDLFMFGSCAITSPSSDL